MSQCHEVNTIAKYVTMISLLVFAVMVLLIAVSGTALYQKLRWAGGSFLISGIISFIGIGMVLDLFTADILRGFGGQPDIEAIAAVNVIATLTSNFQTFYCIPLIALGAIMIGASFFIASKLEQPSIETHITEPLKPEKVKVEQVEEEAEISFCPKCGSEIKGDYKFCRKCGTKAR